MDKQTLSQYGWVVICVLVLAVMIAMATPFGTAIKGSVNDTVGVMDESASSALDDAFDGEEEDTNEVTMLEGNGQKFNTALPKTLSFRSSADIDTFESVEINGTIVDPSNYTVTEGSTIITLKEECLSLLNDGTHEIEIVSEAGTADANFEVGYYPGFYDESDELVVSWDEFKAEYPELFDGSELMASWNGFAENFFNDNAIAKVVIDESITRIGNEAFMDACFLRTVVLPESLEYVGYSAFAHSGITEVRFMDGVDIDGDSLFVGCEYLTKVTLPEGLTTIGNSMFSGCSALESIVLPESVEVIECAAFEKCSSLTNITIPNAQVVVESEYPFNVFNYYGGEVNFGGNTDEWNAFFEQISHDGQYCFTVHCTDGDLTMEKYE